MLKEIFKNIEGREWDWFGYGSDKLILPPEDAPEYRIRINAGWFSLADFLANKSWCKAVWGRVTIHECDETFVIQKERQPCICGRFRCGIEAYKLYSTKAFQILQQEGKEAALKYIKETMI